MDRIAEQMHILISPVYLPTSSFSLPLSLAQTNPPEASLSPHIHAHPQTADNGWPPLYEENIYINSNCCPLSSLKRQALGLIPNVFFIHDPGVICLFCTIRHSQVGFSIAIKGTGAFKSQKEHFFKFKKCNL